MDDCGARIKRLEKKIIGDRCPRCLNLLTFEGTGGLAGIIKWLDWWKEGKTKELVCTCPEGLLSRLFRRLAEMKKERHEHPDTVEGA